LSVENFKPQEEEIDLWDLFFVLLKRAKIIIGITLFGLLLGFLKAFLTPPIYRAEVTILPPQTPSQKLPFVVPTEIAIQLGVPSLTPSNVFLGLPTTRVVLDNLIRSFNLLEVYGVKSFEDAREILKKRIKPTMDQKTGLLTISVEDRNPQRAAQMANKCVEEMEKLLENVAVTEASQRRKFLERELEKAKVALIAAEEELRKFMKTTKILEVSKQSEATIGLLAEFQGKIAAKEAELRALKTVLGEGHPRVLQVKNEIQALRAQYDTLEKKSSGGALIPVEKAAEKGVEYIEKMREFKYREALYEMLLKLFEQAKLEESREILIQVIDPAVPPEKKAKPKRFLIISISTFLGLFIGILCAFLLEAFEKARKDPSRAEKMEQIIQEIKSFASWLKKP